MYILVVLLQNVCLQSYIGERGEKGDRGPEGIGLEGPMGLRGMPGEYLLQI